MIKMLFEFIKIGAFTYGGGLAMIPLLQDVAVENGWLTAVQFADLIAISQSTPGPIAINMATYIGYREFGVYGAVVMSIAVVLPAFFMAIALSKVLYKYKKHPYITAAFVGLKATVIGLIGTSIIQVALVSIYEHDQGKLLSFWQGIDYKALALLCISLLIIRKTQKHPLIYIIGFGLVSIFIW